MALINCPQCGGNVSDSAEKCPHCGYDFSAVRKKEEQAKVYNNLPEYEQKALQNEFNAKFPEEAKAMQKLKLFNIARFIVSLIIIGLLITFVALQGFNSDKKILINFLTVFMVGLIYRLLDFFAARKLSVRKYQNLKRFCKWLKDENGLTYKLTLSAKEKKLFDKAEI